MDPITIFTIVAAVIGIVNGAIEATTLDSRSKKYLPQIKTLTKKVNQGQIELGELQDALNRHDSQALQLLTGLNPAGQLDKVNSVFDKERKLKVKQIENKQKQIGKDQMALSEYESKQNVANTNWVSSVTQDINDGFSKEYSQTNDGAMGGIKYGIQK